MRHLILLSILVLAPITLSACSCSGPNHSFLQHAVLGFARTDRRPTVIRARVDSSYVLDQRVPLANLVVQEVLVGFTPPDTISALGQDGLNCNSPLTELVVGREYYFFFRAIDVGAHLPTDSIADYEVYNYGICATGSVAIEDSLVTGHIGWDVSEMDSASFRLWLDRSIEEGRVITSTRPEPFGGERPRLFPNPTSEAVTVNFSTVQTVDQIGVYDATGRLLFVREPRAVGTAYEISLAGLKPGVYTVMLTSSGGRLTQRIIVR